MQKWTMHHSYFDSQVHIYLYLRSENNPISIYGMAIARK